jgi:hypothetical protein
MNEPKLTDEQNVICHDCGNEYQRIGYHWSNNDCTSPTIPDIKQQLLDGLMLGDATLRTHTDTPFIQTYMINEPFLEWINTQLGWITTGVSLYRTAERSAELSRNNGKPADAVDYHDVYVMKTRTLNQFDAYESWYTTDGKRFPNDIVLTPTIAKIWYACDGSLNWDRRYPSSRPHITIGASNEMDNAGNLVRMFEESTFSHVPTIDDRSIRFTVDATEDLIEWMGDAPPGFEYKWCLDSLDAYESAKDTVLGPDPEPT